MRRRTGLPSSPIEFLPRRFFFVAVRERTACSLHRSRSSDQESNSSPIPAQRVFPRTPGIHFVSLHEQLLSSKTTSSDFALGIPQTLRFNTFLTNVLTAASRQPIEETTGSISSPRDDCNTLNCDKVYIFFLRRQHLHEEIQAIHLICRWRLLHLHLSPHDALAPFEHLPYLFSSSMSSSVSLDPPSLLGSLAAIAKGISTKVLDPTNTVTFFNSPGGCQEPIAANAEDQDLNAISDRFVLYNGPFDQQTSSGHERGGPQSEQDDQSMRVLERVISALKLRKVSLVVILSKKHCDASVFASGGLEALDLSPATSPTSPTPTTDKASASPPTDEALVSRFLEVCERTVGSIALHSSSGSGRVSAATCIGCYLMKHLGFTSQEAVGWLRLCHPGKIPAAWELFLDQMQPQMWLEGEKFRRSREIAIADDISDSSATDSLHINIGKISLGRISLLGTRDRLKQSTDTHQDNVSATICLSSRTLLEPHQSPTAATTVAQLKRRPLTQGSTGGRRLYRASDGTSLRADFALMHKFVHQSATSNTPSPLTGTATTAAKGDVSLVPCRPKDTPRTPDAT